MMYSDSLFLLKKLFIEKPIEINLDDILKRLLVNISSDDRLPNNGLVKYAMSFIFSNESEFNFEIIKKRSMSLFMTLWYVGGQRSDVLQNLKYKSQSSDSFSDVETLENVCIPEIFEFIYKNIENNSIIAFLYCLVYNSPIFRMFVASQTNIHYIIIPFLKSFYRYSSGDSLNSLYLKICVLLLLSQDDIFSANIQNRIVDPLNVIDDKIITVMNLESLLVVVLINLATINISLERVHSVPDRQS
ncbi:hypothetical protein O9G_005227 [Rozella allomycis CSF55]|uniref:Dymeclin n=1 Tax=Rozella allomycis (strain CSF55) TaxID=988480 RepID=A0A075AYS7_ROZAC|nr:hypothetical protein O9G_005227 [Rozella allomycis CSF55]|eukprot:EPZ35465.1 hypothetical protein O9G_005227 [Rozella allomycis CSF55]